jgi:hypothetical protein
MMQRQQQKQQQQQHAGMNGTAAAAVRANANAGQQQCDVTDASPVVRDMWLYIQVREVHYCCSCMSAYAI